MTEPITGNQLRGHLDAIVLAVLDDGETHGFNLLKRLQERGEGAFALKEGTVYPVLYRLEQAGLVTARWDDDDSDRRGPRRRLYKLTRKGHRSLAEARVQWTQFVKVLGNILAPTSQPGTTRPFAINFI